MSGNSVVLLAADVLCGDILHPHQHLQVGFSIQYHLHLQNWCLRFFEYRTAPLNLQTAAGANITVFIAQPTELRLHPTYSKVSKPVSLNFSPDICGLKMFPFSWKIFPICYQQMFPLSKIIFPHSSVIHICCCVRWARYAPWRCCTCCRWSAWPTSTAPSTLSSGPAVELGNFDIHVVRKFSKYLENHKRAFNRNKSPYVKLKLLCL